MQWMWYSVVEGETVLCIVCFSDLSTRMMEVAGSFRYVSSAVRHMPEDRESLLDIVLSEFGISRTT